MNAKLEQAKALILMMKEKNQIFSVEFIKRTTGEKRLMVCRFGVKAHLAGGELKFDPFSKGLVPVFDMQKNDYRMINLDTILKVNANGEEIIVQEEEVK